MPIVITCGSLVNTRSICPGIRLKTSVPMNIIPIPPTSEVDSVFLQRSIRSEIIAVCGFHKIIPCENSYFHRGFYARKSYKSICFSHPFTPSWDAFSFLKFINDKHTPVLHMPAAFLPSVWNNFRSKAWHLQESAPLLLLEWKLLFP